MRCHQARPASGPRRPEGGRAMKAACPRLVIAGTGSGVGKTSLALGLARCLARQGLARADVQGRARLPRSDLPGHGLRPDLLQPRRLDDFARVRARALRPGHGRRRHRADRRRDGPVRRRIAHARSKGSTAEIARWLDAPVLLVANAHGAARSLAATVKGFAQFEPGVRVAGVIANQGGSPAASRLAGRVAGRRRRRRRCWAWCRADRCPRCPAGTWDWSPPTRRAFPPAILDQLADACEQAPRRVRDRWSWPGRAREQSTSPQAARATAAADRDRSGDGRPIRQVRLGIARDEAFHFYYPDNLESLARSRRRVGAVLAAGRRAAARRSGRPVLRRRLSRAARRPAGRQRGDAGRRPAVRRLGRRDLCRMRRADVPGPDARPRSTACAIRWPACCRIETAMLAEAQGAGLCRGHLDGRLALGPRRPESPAATSSTISEITADDGPADGWQPAYTVRRRRRRAGPRRFLQGKRPGRLRASALGIAAGGDASFPLSLRGTIMSNTADTAGHPHHQPRQPAGRGQPGLRRPGRAGRRAAGAADVLPAFFSIARPNIPDQVAVLAVAGRAADRADALFSLLRPARDRRHSRPAGRVPRSSSRRSRWSCCRRWRTIRRWRTWWSSG